MVTVDTVKLGKQADHGTAVLTRLSPLVGLSVPQLRQKIRLCGPKVPQPCYAGSPYQPVPVRMFDPANQAALQKALLIEERPEDYPAIGIGQQSVRVYPKKALAGHTLGYVRPITAAEKTQAKFAGYQDNEIVGQAGLESQYDRKLRGTPATRTVQVNAAGVVTKSLHVTQPKAGDTLVTNIDGALQQDVGKQLEAGIARAQSQVGSTGSRLLGTTAAAVVVDVTNGAVLAMASAPSYDPNTFVGTLTDAEFAKLSDPSASNPLISRATSAAFPPGSTFKGASATAILANGLTSPGATTACPSSLPVGNQDFRNFEGEAVSYPISITEALERSCDTFFYKYAFDQWYNDGGLRVTKAQKAKPVREIFAKNAKSMGYGSPTGVDLPNESPGIVYDRAALRKYWLATKADDCKGAKTYAQSDPQRAKLDAYNCTDGYRLQAGNAVQFAIGQGANIEATPLQQAMAYAAIGNGGTVYEPQVAKALLKPDGTVDKLFKPRVKNKLDAAQIQALSTVRDGLRLVVQGPHGTATGAGFDAQLDVGGKTGTADVASMGPLNGQPDSWFTSLQPISKPKYAVVAIVEHGGQGGADRGRRGREHLQGHLRPGRARSGVAGRAAAGEAAEGQRHRRDHPGQRRHPAGHPAGAARAGHPRPGGGGQHDQVPGCGEG